MHWPCVIVLDFDGVIVESNDIKYRAFDRIFQAYPDHLEQIRDYIRKHHHTDRHGKFRHILNEILRLPQETHLLERWASQFRGDTRRAILECPFVPEADRFLREFSAIVPLYIASATPQDELDWVVQSRGIRPYFKAVYGSSRGKADILREILRMERLSPSDALFIGDTLEDFSSSREAGVPFWGREASNTFSQANCRVFTDFSGIRTALSK